MATINGKALVKDGKPLDRVYSNGRLVYGRNLLSGTRDFSGTWVNSSSWVTDGTYKDLTVKKRTSKWDGINKIFTAPKDGNYTFSNYVKGSGATTDIIRYGEINGVQQTYKHMYGQFDWLFDSVTVSMKAGQIAFFRYEISTSNVDAILWNAGHKWEEGSTATPWTPAPEDYI